MAGTDLTDCPAVQPRQFQEGRLPSILMCISCLSCGADFGYAAARSPCPASRARLHMLGSKLKPFVWKIGPSVKDMKPHSL
eukprot:1287311-Rhodomonas_salina.1